VRACPRPAAGAARFGRFAPGRDASAQRAARKRLTADHYCEKLCTIVHSVLTPRPPTKGVCMSFRLAKKPRTLATIAAVGAAVAALTTAGAAPAAAASTPAPVTQGSRYLALGDSIAFGYREGDAVQTPNYQKPATFHGYPYLIAKNLGLRLTNAACPGETAASFITAGHLDHGCTLQEDETSPGYRTAFPLHTKYTGSSESQLQFAIAYLKKFPNTRLVTLQIGANDGLRCIELGNCDTLQQKAMLAQRVQRRLTTILNALTTKAGYHGQLVLVNYYSVNSASQAANDNSNLLNLAEAAVARNYKNVTIADSYARFASASRNAPFNNTCAAGLETLLTDNVPPNGTCGIHPSLAGHALIASSVERVVHKA
jgi:lysophospholipase L1-like esterase